MRPLLVILNPLAGMKRAAQVLASILDIFCKADFEPIVRTTQRRGDGCALAREYAGRVDRFVCIGGDGTFNEVVSGVLQSGCLTPIGYIPAGSTNDFAMSLGLSRDILQAANDIVEGTPTPMDVGHFGERFFTYVASFGAFTKASYATNQSAKNVLGHLAYLLSGAALIPSIHSIHAELTTDSGELIAGEYLFGAVGNSTSMGGVLTLDRSIVNMHDGTFELLLVRNPTDAIQLGECVRALLAQDYASDMLIFRQVNSLTARIGAENDWTLDGEYCKGQDEVRIDVLPAAIHVIVNNHEKHDALLY